MDDILKNYNIISNNSKKYINGSTWINNDGCKYEIIGHTDRIKNGTASARPYYLCKFEDGTIVEASYNHIYDGQIKNPNYPSVCGVGCFGVGKWKATINYKKTKEYQLWCRLLNCCYNTECKYYKDYGGKGVTVSNEWLNYQQFCNDIQYLPGYDEWNTTDLEYVLDKDILCDKKGIYPKIYSKETCIFITYKKNSEISSVTGKQFLATRVEDNYNEEFDNILNFVKKYNLVYSSVRNCIYGKSKLHRGWKFEIINNTDV